MGKKEAIGKSREFLFILLIAVAVLLVAVSITNISQENIAGRAFYHPMKMYGEIQPDLPDGTKIEFKVSGHIDIAETEINDNAYGYDTPVYLKMDDDATEKIEGYAPGYEVKAYIEGIQVAEWSYFEKWETRKDITLPADKRAEITNKAQAASFERRCEPEWECSPWTGCVNQTQKRVCIDLNQCKKDEGKPEETRECSKIPSIQQPSDKTEFWKMLIIMFIVFLIPGLLSRDMNSRYPGSR